MNRSRARWTVLAYFAGERELAEAMILSLKEMYRVGGARRCNVVAQFNPLGSPPQRFTIARDESAGSSVSSAVPTGLSGDGRLHRLGKVVSANRGDPAILDDGGLSTAERHRATLESFVTSAIIENPSDHYLLLLSGHASGVVGRRVDQHGFSPGATRTLDLGPMFESIRTRTGRVIDVLGMDACFMSMCEVCWELRGTVRFLVGSEGSTPQYGWPYHRILELLRDTEQIEPGELASAIVARYLRYRADFDLAGLSVDLSACDLARIDHLAEAVGRLCRAMELRLTHPRFRDALVLSRWTAQSYKSEQYVDLWDFCELLSARCEDDITRGECQRVTDALSSPVHGVVRKSVFNGPAYQHSHGLSIYFPWSIVALDYERFGFAETTGWRRFLTKYVIATRRELRIDSNSRRLA